MTPHPPPSRPTTPPQTAGAKSYGRPGRRLLAITAVLVILLVAAGTLLTIERYESERRAIFTESLGDATSVAARVDQFFEGRIETLETIARMPLIRLGEPAAIKEWFEDLVEAGSTFTGGLSLIGTDGVMLLLSGFPLDEPPVDLSDRGYVQEVLATGRPALGDAIIGRLSGDPLVTLAVPVVDDHGDTQAILAGTIRIDLPAGGFTALGTSMSEAVILDGSAQVVLDRGVVTEPMFGAPTFLSVIGSGTGVEEGVSDPKGDGRWLAGWAPVGQTEWRAVVLESLEVRLTPASRSLVLALAVLGLLGLAGMLIAILVARRLDAAAAREGRDADELREREAFLHRFADALPVMAGTLDQTGRTTFANATLRQASESGLADVLHPDDLGHLPPASTPTPSATTEIRVRDAGSPDGYRWHRIGFVEARGPGGGWFFAAADIDDEVREELDLRRDIQQRDEFLGLVSHELRTPLTIIRGNALLLSKPGSTASPAEVADGLVEIEASSRHLQRLLENMLVLSRLSTFDPGTEIEPLRIAVLVRRVVSEFIERHPGAIIHVESDEHLPIVAANDIFVDQVIWNLLTNAERYGGAARTITVTVGAHGPMVEIAVIDGGPGIPVADLERIFDPHFRSQVTRDQANGLGLGLTVCRRLVEWQGGTMSAAPNPGGGMRFAFTLPTLDDQEPPPVH